jgi:transcriptional regulator with XRE-family HTH domain
MLGTMMTDPRLLRVREIREAQGMTVAELASKAGLPSNTVRSYDRDVPELFNRRVLVQLAKALGVPVKDLFLEDQ